MPDGTQASMKMADFQDAGAEMSADPDADRSPQRFDLRRL